jgi:TctA family transporter
MIALVAAVIAAIIVIGLFAGVFYLVGIVGVISMMVFGAVGYLVATYLNLAIGWIVFGTILGGLLGIVFLPKRNF